jgi:hypothetical protein
VAPNLTEVIAFSSLSDSSVVARQNLKKPGIFLNAGLFYLQNRLPGITTRKRTLDMSYFAQIEVSR